MGIKNIAILTGGGDCPGLNAAIRAIAKTAMYDYGWNVIGILDGYQGLISGKKRNLKPADVSNILTLGGTILGTSNKADPFEKSVSGAEILSKSVLENLDKWEIDALFCIGGDGTNTVANKISKVWPNIIGVPKTIDNDLLCTDQTFGFDTACAFVTESLDRIHSTAQSHHRAMVIEVMGRYAGWIALAGGLAGGGDVILIPEIPFKWEAICEAINRRSRIGKRFSIVVVSEGAHPAGEKMVVRKLIKDSPDPIRLGGIGQVVADRIELETGIESRVTVLGHLQRGGSPSFFDRILATKYGVAAVRMAYAGKFGTMAAMREGRMVPVSLDEVTAGLKLVKENDELVVAAKSLGTSFGV
ncbi:MAG TPA: ATP-dependent 6-phosphofructokinase [bacterium]|nr:MAG: Pyrophosphate--fructose 6-phosphate 1-phosphotransferase [bacterium ADurb.Bin270]HPW45130.1 ATP-dependent 6-phosphofructokinase [bacterium]